MPMWIPKVVAVLLLLLLAIPPSTGTHTSSQTTERTEGPDWTMAGETPKFASAPPLTAMNLTWNSSLASRIPTSVTGLCGRSLSGMVTNGGNAMIFLASYLGPSGSCTSASFSSDTLLYNESNNTWWSLHSLNQPPPIANFSLASDPGYSGGVALLFDGESPISQTLYNGTWEFYFSNDTWRQLHPTGGPSARVFAAVAADPRTGDVLVIGGVNSTAGFDDNDWWSLNLTTAVWSYQGLAPSLFPGNSRIYGSSFISEVPGRLLLFGGCTSLITTSCSNATADIFPNGAGGWTYAVNTTSGPSPRAFASFAWDPFMGSAVLFGGEDLRSSPASVLNDTWTFSPLQNRWIRQEMPPWGPSPRLTASLGWLNSPTNETGVLSGGISTAPGPGNNLWRLTPSAHVLVKVTNLTGVPILSANVKVHSSGGVWTNVTNASGLAVLSQVAGGVLSIVTNATGYYQNTTPGYVPPNGTFTITVKLTPLPILRVRTYTPATTGRVPLGSVSLLWDAGTTPVGTTNAAGYQNFTAPHGGHITITGVKKGYLTTSNNTTVPTVGVAFLNLTLRIIQPANLTVEVRNPQKMALNKVVVRVVNASENLSLVNTTDALGQANFTDLPGFTSINVTATAPTGYYSNTTQASLSAGNRTWLNITLTPWPTLHVHVLGTVDGVSTKVDVPGAAVYRNATYLGTGSSKGWFNVTTSPGAANVSASAIGFHPGFVNARLNRTGPTNVTLLLVAWPSLHARVFGNQTSGPALPLAGANLSSNVSGPLGVTGPLGWLNVTLAPGPERVSANHPDYRSAALNLTLGYTGVLNATFFLQPLLANFSVRVLTTLGVDYINGSSLRPLASAQVNLTRSTGRFLFFITDARGYANSTVVEGNYTFASWEYGFKHAPPQGPRFVNTSGTTLLTFILYPVPGANVSVLIHDRNTSAPIRNATVEVGLYHQALTDPVGWANFTDILPPARYTVFAAAAGYRSNETNVTLTFYQVIPRLLLNLTKLPPPPSHNETGNSSWSLVPPTEQYVWWPFLVLPAIFAIGAFVVIVSQRSRRRT